LVLVASWTVLALDSAWLAWRERRRGEVVPQARRVHWLAGSAVLVVTVASAFWLERLTGRLPSTGPLVVLGLVLAGVGVWLHARARRALGIAWSTRVEVREGQGLVTHGPYAYIRHPIYLAVLLLSAGTVLAHPSLATGSIAFGLVIGVVLKARLEERTLHAALGKEHQDYTVEVPAFIPRPGRRRGAE
jgi:protein-S-isoprenylcysteine O-methyltransferase Ste14